MRVGFLLGLTAVVFTLIVGCESPGRVSSTGVARDSAGIRLIALPNRGIDDMAIQLSVDPSWTPADELEIGDLIDIAIVQGRGVLLLDELAGSVTFLSDSGEVLAVIGRDGQGPGEFNPQGLSQIVATDSSVFVPDLFLQRLTEFSLDGEVLGIQSFPLSPVYAVDWRKHPDGGLAFRAFEQFGDQIIHLSEGTADTILSFQVSNDHTNLLLSPITVWDLGEDGSVLSARTDQAAVELRRRQTGKVVWRTQWAHPAEEVGEADLAHLEGLVRDRILRDTPDITGEGLAENLALIQYPERTPVLAGLMAAPGGDTWVRRAKPVREMGIESLRVGSAEAYGGQLWDVLDQEGFLKARIRLPAGFTPRRFGGEWLYGILADELGIETAARVGVRF